MEPRGAEVRGCEGAPSVALFRHGTFARPHPRTFALKHERIIERDALGDPERRQHYIDT